VEERDERRARVMERRLVTKIRGPSKPKNLKRAKKISSVPQEW